MTDDNSGLPREQMADEARRYSWYHGYDRDDEYGKDPPWAAYLAAVDESDGTTTYEDQRDPEHRWITSDTTTTLMDRL